ncbi:MAG: transglycosylase domain-containing protein [Firmicutes bacterium]|nr:transglycosylase domain-containing protein [Bacillota bacterium]
MKTIKRLLSIILIVAIAAASLVIWQGYEMYSDAVAKVSIEEKVAEIMEKEHYTAYDELPETYVAAVIAAEDRRFQYHKGFDIISTARAAWRNIKSKEIVEGGSTITQQLGRIMYFSQEKKYSRKVAEVLVAGRIEEIYEKDKIFELYVNTIYFGSGYYSVYDASMGYFGKAPGQMNDYECTMLAGIPNAPSVYSPDVNPTLAEQRRQQVLVCMAEAGYIEPGEIE